MTSRPVRRRLRIRRETLRALSLGREQLARVAGGGGYDYDYLTGPCADSDPCGTVGKTSKYCPVNI